MIRIITISAVLLFSISSLKGQVIIAGKIENLPASVNLVAVDYWSGESWTEIDRMEIGADKSFTKKVKVKFGQTRLRLWGEPTHWIDFLMPANPSRDSILNFGAIDYRYFDGNPAKLKGPEHEAYYFLQTDHKKYRLLRDSLAKSDSMPAAARLGLEKQVEQAKIFSNKQCKAFSGALKGTFTGDIIANLLYVPVKTDYATDERIQTLSRSDFEREYLLDRLPLSDSRVLLHNGLIRALNQYTSKFLDADSSEYIKKVLGKMRGNEAVDAWLFKYLFQVSMNYKNDPALSYLVKWHQNTSLHKPIEVDQATEILLTAFRNCEPGKKAFNLVLPDMAGKLTKPAEIAAKSKLTLLLFWRTDCSHCREFEPELDSLYRYYKPLGLEVIGISMDMEEANLRNYLNEHPVPWITLFPSSREQRIQMITHFPVPGTPTVIAVDKDFVVKNRMVIRTDIERYLADELGN